MDVVKNGAESGACSDLECKFSVKKGVIKS